MRNLSVLLMATAVLTRCAHAQPASAPIVEAHGWIHLVPTETEDPACNRPALELLWLKKKQADRTHKLALFDCVERAEIAESRARTANARAERGEWWSLNGGYLVGVVGIAAFIAGALAGFGIGK